MISQYHHIRIALSPSTLVLSHSLFRIPSGESTHLGHNSLALEASPHAVVDTLGLPPALANAVEAVTLVTLELRSALLDDRDMLLCGNHLCGCVLVKSGSGRVGWICGGKTRVEIVGGTFCSRVAIGRRTFAVFVVGRCRSEGSLSIRNEALVWLRCSCRMCEFHQMLGEQHLPSTSPELAADCPTLRSLLPTQHSECANAI